MITLAYLGEPSIESLSGILFVHNLDGDFESASAYKNGKLIKRAVSKTDKAANNKSTDGSCIEDRIAYLTVYGVEGYEEFFQGECIGGTTVVVNTSGGGIDTSTNGNTDFYIPSVDDGLSPSGGGGSSTSGGNDNNTPDAVISPDPFWPENVSPSSSVMLSLLSDLQLTLQEEQYLESLPENSLILYQMRAYLDQNNKSPEAKDFIKEAISAGIEGGEVDFEDRIIYNLSDRPCQDAIIKSVVGVSSNFTNAINSTFNTNDRLNLKFTSLDISSGDPARTAPFPQGSQASYSINIQFDNNYLDKATNVSIASNALHEMVHAYLINLYITSQMSAQSDNYNDLLNAFIAYYDNQVQDTATTLDNEIHNAMKDFINKLAQSLNQYCIDNNIPNTDLAFCEKMIWSTMYGTDLFNQVLTPQQQIEYGNTDAIEQDNNQNYSPKGTACN